jgi:hypothetical protein
MQSMPAGWVASRTITPARLAVQASFSIEQAIDDALYIRST